MLNHWIWLSTRKDIKVRDIVAILQYFGDPESVYYAQAEGYRRIPGMNVKTMQSLCDKSLDGARQIIQTCRQKRIHVLTFQDAAYPKRLKSIPDPPVVLYYKGVLPDFDEMPVIAGVGTRACSDYGMEMARRMGYQLTRGGAAVVSGMAEGIDAGIIGGALVAGGPVIGILGCGVDRIYPASNAGLYESVMKQGCLISEFPPGTQPFKWNFPKRNRLISGISNGILVVEAPEKSGALITARQGLEQGKELFAVPGNVNSEYARGSNQLISDGATMVCCGGNILERYQARYPSVSICDDECPGLEELENLILQVGGSVGTAAVKQEKNQEANKKMIDIPTKPPYIDVEKSNPQLSEQEKSIVSQLIQGPRNTDEVVLSAGLSMGKAMSVLTMLEIKGIIRRMPGNIIALREQ